jgi:O-antigen/teichoic acid export membrane protein
MRRVWPGDGSEVSRAAGDALTLLVAASVAQLLAIGLNVLLRRQLGVDGMAYVVITQLALTYSSYVGLGTLQAAEREIPIELSRGRRDVVRDIERFAWAASLIGGVAVAAVLVAVALLVVDQDDPLLRATFVTSGAILVAQQVTDVSAVRLRTRLRFRWVAALNAVYSVAFIGVVLAGAIAGAVYGALAATVVSVAVVSGLFGLVAKPSLRFGGSLRAARHLLTLAPGFLFSSLAFVGLMSIDQLAVAFLLGTGALGVYSAAVLGKTFVLAFPGMVGAVIYPRLQRELGASTDPATVFGITARTTSMVVLAMPLVVAVFFVTLPLVIRFFLPEFADAVVPMRLLLVAAGALGFGIPAVQLLLSLDRQWLETAITGAAAALFVAGCVVMSSSGVLSVAAVAWLTATIYAAYALAVQWLAARVAGQSAMPIIQLWSILIATLAVLLITAPVADRLSGDRGSPAMVIAGLAVQIVPFLAAWVVGFVVLLRLRPQARHDLASLVEPLLARWR